METSQAVTKRLPVTAIVMTRNEERNLRKCLRSIAAHVTKIILVDSDSDDDTLAIAREFNCEIYNHPPATQASVLKWFLEDVSVDTEWIMRVDADERWNEEGFDQLSALFRETDLEGIYVNRKTYFMGKWLRYGGYYPISLLLVWRRGAAYVEPRLMDEHLFVRGRTIVSSIDVDEDNYDRQQNIGAWTTKHNLYSDRYAAEAILDELGLAQEAPLSGPLTHGTVRKSQLRVHLYDRLPLYIRALLYFIYRYFFQLGFLDGGRGFIYHFLQAFWFRFLIDVKISQVRANIRAEGCDPLQYLREHLGVRVVDGRVYLREAYARDSKQQSAAPRRIDAGA